MNGIRILVVEDDSTLLAGIADTLECEGYEVRTVANGAEGLHAMRQMRPQVIILDMHMPVLDGRSFARTLQAQGLHVPIIAMSGASDAARWACDIGADAFLFKPFDPLELLQAVDCVRAFSAETAVDPDDTAALPRPHTNRTARRR